MVSEVYRFNHLQKRKKHFDLPGCPLYSPPKILERLFNYKYSIIKYFLAFGL